MKNVILPNPVLSLLIGKMTKISKNSPKYVQIKHSICQSCFGQMARLTNASALLLRVKKTVFSHQ